VTSLIPQPGQESTAAALALAVEQLFAFDDQGSACYREQRLRAVQLYADCYLTWLQGRRESWPAPNEFSVAESEATAVRVLARKLNGRS
jgi:hypothetical protein